MSELISLDMDIPSIQYLCKKDKRLAKVISMMGSISYATHNDDPYSFLVHEIIEQMLSVKAGRKIYGRLETLCNGEITPERINSLTDEEIRGTGTSNAKVGYIHNVTNAILDGSLDFNTLQEMSDKEVIKTPTKIRGIGNLTAKMYLMFVLDRPNIIPFEDGAFLQVYRWVYKIDDCSEKAVHQKCKKWSPYATIASRFFIVLLDAGMTK